MTFALGGGLVGIAGWIYWRQRDRTRFVRLMIRLKNRVGALLGRRWPDAPVRRFLDEHYEGKATIRRSPCAFYRMAGLPYLTIACDVVALYVVLVALDVFPSVWVAFMGFVLAMAGLAVVSVRGGGGSFEVILSAYLTSRGLDKAQAIAGAILYRIVAFWLPAFVSLFLFAQFRRRTREIRAVTAEARGREARAR